MYTSSQPTAQTYLTLIIKIKPDDKLPLAPN